MNSLLVKSALVIVVFAVVSSVALQAQQSNNESIASPAQPRQANAAEQRKAQLDLEKLELEIARLKENNSSWPSWLTGLLGVGLGAASTAVGILAKRGDREQGTDQVTHEARLACYPKLVNATSPLAIYFPVHGEAGALTPERCSLMGRKMSRWYFASGGLLMSEQTRDAYFILARALTRASLAPELKVPRFPDDADKVSAELIKSYRDELGTEVDDWRFGDSSANSEAKKGQPAHEFKDYVFLQHLSSTLRTALADDLRSRRQPT